MTLPSRTELRICLATLLLVVGTVPALTPNRADLILLRQRLELARSGSIFLMLKKDVLTVGVRNLEFKSLPMTKAERVGPSAFRTSTIQSVHPAAPVKTVREHVSEILQDTTGAVSSPDEIVGVEDMAADYFLQMRDGSVIVVTSDGLHTPRSWVRQRILAGRAAITYLRERLLGNNVKFIKVHFSRDHAREIFWLLREGTAIIF